MKTNLAFNLGHIPGRISTHASIDKIIFISLTLYLVLNQSV